MADFKLPDLKAPRLRRPVGKGISMDRMLKKLKTRNPGKFDSMTAMMIKNVITVFNQHLQEEIVTNVDGVDLPSKLGFVQLVSCPTKNKNNINFGESIKLNKRVYHRNLNSNGKVGRLFYSNIDRKHYVQNRFLWRYEATREFKRLVSREYPKNWERYIIYDKLADTSTSTNRQRAAYSEDLKLEQHSKIDFSNYDEFDLD